MAQDVNLYCIACESLLIQVARRNILPNKVEFDLLCDSVKGGCGRQHRLTRTFNGTTKPIDIFLLVRLGREDRLRG